MKAVVGGLRVYPVKSCRGIAVERSPVEARGLQHDRRWMIVDPAGTFVTQRTVPRMALVQVALEGEGSAPRPGELPPAPDVLALRFPAMPELRVPTRPPHDAATRAVTVWRDRVQAVDCGPEAAAWVTAALGTPLALVYLPGDVQRAVNPKHARPGDLVGFADGYPLLIACVSSLQDLNARMDAPLPMDRFRPNIVVHDTPPWAEDTWRRVEVGRLSIRVVKPCARCVITGTDQETAARGVEPMRTLSTFRRVDNDVLFARNAIPDGDGTIAVGDAVTVFDEP